MAERPIGIQIVAVFLVISGILFNSVSIFLSDSKFHYLCHHILLSIPTTGKISI